MSLQFLSDKPKTSGKSYNKPEEILSDPYLSAPQKYMVLEAVLSDIRGIGVLSKQDTKISQEILKAQDSLRKHMD